MGPLEARVLALELMVNKLVKWANNHHVEKQKPKKKRKEK